MSSSCSRRPAGWRVQRITSTPRPRYARTRSSRPRRSWSDVTRIQSCSAHQSAISASLALCRRPWILGCGSPSSANRWTSCTVYSKRGSSSPANDGSSRPAGIGAQPARRSWTPRTSSTSITCQSAICSMLWDTSSLAMTTIGRRMPFTTGSPNSMFGTISIRSVSSQVVATFAREIRFGAESEAVGGHTW